MPCRRALRLVTAPPPRRAPLPSRAPPPWKERTDVAALRPSALVYGDVDLNLLDGSAIWLQSVTQALVAAGCAVTLVLKAPVRTDRLVAPLRDVEAVTISSPHAESLLPGLTDASLTVPQAISVLAAVDAVHRHD